MNGCEVPCLDSVSLITASSVECFTIIFPPIYIKLIKILNLQ